VAKVKVLRKPDLVKMKPGQEVVVEMAFEAKGENLQLVWTNGAKIS